MPVVSSLQESEVQQSPYAGILPASEVSAEPGVQRPRLLFLVPEDWYFWTHRRGIAMAARSAGFEVIIATRVQNHGARIERAGFKLVPIRLRRSSRNPIRELRAIADLIAIYRQERPCLVHQVTIKPVLYGSLAAVLAGVPAIVDAVAGLGEVFIAKGWQASLRRRLVTFGYRLALGPKRSRTIFQNPDDQNAFVNHGVVAAEKAVLIRGAGVDLTEFSWSPEPKGIPVVMHAGRLLWSKGIGELVDAAKLLRKRGFELRVVLVGEPDHGNPRFIPEEVLRRWEREGAVEWWGRRENMPQVLSQANLMVLPTTYAEGVPKILLEAAAVGRALIATDVSGCREIVRHQQNGLLVPPHDVAALADAMGRLLREPETRMRMGQRGRAIAVAEFSSKRVVEETLAVYRELLRDRWPQSDEPEDVRRKAA